MTNHLNQARLIGFVPSTDLQASALFYCDKLGLALLHSDDYALELQTGNSKIRVAKVNEALKAAHTIVGWEVDDIDATVEELRNRGIAFVFYEGMPQDEKGVCSFPNGGKVAWFKDPDENVLSITQN